MQKVNKNITFELALKKLNISEYKERILNSNSHGELFHCYDYILLAKFDNDMDMTWFRDWFINTVKFAENNWNKPESIFQHIPKMLYNSLKKD